MTVNGAAATEDANNNFSGSTALTTGTNTVTVIANDYDGNSSTNKYSIVVPPATGTAPTFDANGNLTTDSAGNIYSWDAKDEMVGIAYVGGAKTSFTYDGLGRRVKIVEKNSSGTVTSTKQFIWLGSGIAEERDASNAVQKRFYAQGEQIAGTSYFYTRDHLGSVREMVDASGTIQARYDYDPYGRVTKVQGSLDSDFQYAGYYVHAPSGLNLTKFRAYDPNAGRWLSRDPIGRAGGPNLYGYVGNCPSSFIDQSGLCSNSLSTAQEIAALVAAFAAITALLLVITELALVLGPLLLLFLPEIVEGFIGVLEFLSDRLFYEIGQKTLLDSNYAIFSRIADPILRGKEIVQEMGWIRALLPEGYGWILGIGKTFSTLPTPGGWLAAGAGIGAILGFLAYLFSSGK